MSIARVLTLRPLPNKLDEFIGDLAEGKKILEGHGVRVNFYRTVAGPEPNAVLIVGEVDDWPKFGEVAAKLGSDAAFQALQRKIVDTPSAETLSNEIIEQFELPG